MDELLGFVTQLIDYIEANGANLNAETQKELAVFLQEVMQFISEFQQQQGPVESLPPTAAQPELELPMQSSTIEGFNYDYDNGKLLVKFQGDGIYGYDRVPKFIYDTFRKGAVAAKTSGKNQYGRWWKGKTPSLGAAFYALIRNGGYPYQKLK